MIDRVRILAIGSILASIVLADGAFADHVSDAGLWAGISAHGALGRSDDPGPWRWRLAGQGRFREDVPGFNQSFLDVGIGYAITSSVTVSGGYDWLRTDPLSAAPSFDEHRLVQDVSWKHAIGPPVLTSRARIEERFFSNASGVAIRFRGKARLRWAPSEDALVGLILDDEVFLNTNDLDSVVSAGFDQNRLFAGFDVALTPDRKASLELGYLNQYLRPPSGPDNMVHILSLGLVFTP
jgi:hypothetical protein